MPTPHPQRGPSARRLADRLTAQYRIPIEPQYDPGSRRWTLRWYDGPPVSAVRAALGKLGTEAARMLVRRDLTTRALALAAIRETRAGAMHRWVGSWGQRYHLEQILADRPFPDRTDGPREAAMLERLLQAATDAHGRWPHPDENKAFELVARNGVAWLLPDDRLAGPEDRQGIALSPLEYLTARYAAGVHRTAWETALATMPLRAAVIAARDDTAATPDAARAALTLLPDLRTELTADLDRTQDRLNRVAAPV
ncbi:hypothetical protein [Kitasatospora sp. NPDC094015]|uniref:hypothetical protein n=1 Tax=Kitasatospora sp. NPDC094015 TaxID=3155205 RepID=UPI00332ED0A0